MRRLCSILALVACLALSSVALALPAGGEPVEELAGMTPDRAAPSVGAVSSSRSDDQLAAAAWAVHGMPPAPAAQMPALVVSPEPEADLLALARLVIDAARGRNWALLGALVLSLLIALIRRFASRLAVSFAGKAVGRAAAWLTTDRGGALLALLAGVAAAFAAAFGSGGAVSAQTVVDGLVAGITAAGGYAVLRKLVFPSGADRAQQVRATSAAVGEAAAQSPEAAADQINKAIGR